MENQRLILYMALAFVLFLIWQAWQKDYGPQPQVHSPVPATGEALSGQPEGGPLSDLPSPETVESSEPAPPQPGVASAETAPPPATVHVVTDTLDVEISTRGGDIVRVDLPTYPVAWDKKDQPFRLMDLYRKGYGAQSGMIHAKLGSGSVSPQQLAPSHHALFSVDRSEYRLAEGADTLEVTLHWKGAQGVSVDKTYAFRRGSFLIEMSQAVHNGSDRPWVGSQYRQLRHGPVEGKKGAFFIHTYTGAAYYDGKYEKLPFDDISEQPLSKPLKGGWVAILQHYFVSAWVPSADEEDLAYAKELRGPRGPEYIIGLRSDALTVQPGETGAFTTRLYAGPKLQHVLAKIAEGLELVTDYGILTVIAKPLFWLLEHIHALVGNWGLAIILLTVLIKLVFYKLSETSYRSMAKMRAVQPRMAALKERYGDDKQKLNQAMMELYRTEKINPLGGCLPIVVQIPVFIALYWTLLESVELRQAPFVLWIHDLSQMDPYFVLPVLMGISMVIQQRLNPAPLDPIQAKVMMALPIVFTVFFAFFPSGLVLYWLTNNVLSILQQWVITRRIEQQTKG